MKKKINVLYQLQQSEPKYAKLTFETTQKAIALIDSIRLDYFGEDDKQSLLAQSYPIFEKAIALSVDNGNENFAFQLSEKCKAVILYDALKIKRAEIYSGLDDEILLRKYKCKQKLLACQQDILGRKGQKRASRASPNKI